MMGILYTLSGRHVKISINKYQRRDIGVMAELDGISQIDHIRAAKKYLMQLLARREYSVSEVRLKLQQRQVTADVIDQTIAQFIENDWLSDSRFAAAFTRFRQAKGFGPRNIRHQLQQRGVEQSIIDQALNNSETPWIETLQSVREKRFGKADASDFVSKAKQAKFLQYRGFTDEQIRKLLFRDTDYID
ncbi:MAG: regulatory protein RecX [Thiohalomonadales bacterium]